MKLARLLKNQFLSNNLQSKAIWKLTDNVAFYIYFLATTWTKTTIGWPKQDSVCILRWSWRTLHLSMSWDVPHQGQRCTTPSIQELHWKFSSLWIILPQKKKSLFLMNPFIDTNLSIITYPNFVDDIYGPSVKFIDIVLWIWFILTNPFFNLAAGVSICRLWPFLVNYGVQ